MQTLEDITRRERSAANPPRFKVFVAAIPAGRPVLSHNYNQAYAIAKQASRDQGRDIKLHGFSSVREAEKHFGGKIGGDKLAVARGDKKAERMAARVKS